MVDAQLNGVKPKRKRKPRPKKLINAQVACKVIEAFESYGYGLYEISKVMGLDQDMMQDLIARSRGNGTCLTWDVAFAFVQTFKAEMQINEDFAKHVESMPDPLSKYDLRHFYEEDDYFSYDLKADGKVDATLVRDLLRRIDNQFRFKKEWMTPRTNAQRLAEAVGVKEHTLKLIRHRGHIPLRLALRLCDIADSEEIWCWDLRLKILGLNKA